jgi:succinate-semialdehyde dehydrogenase/glutarate-semialdehyde dehydrogenase
MASAAKHLTPLTLELGGKDAAIVLPDAPVDWTARGLVWGAFTNAGQACASIERLYLVKGENTDQLVSRIVSYTKALNLGAGMVPSTQVGPLIDEAQLSRVAAQVEEAKSAGAMVLCGGKTRQDLGGYFYEPTVLMNVSHSMKIMQEETFGPLLPIMVVASIWTQDLDRAENIAEDLEVGTVTINDGLFSFACPQAPWGGIKKSGIGKSHSHFGLMDLVNVKHISIDSAGGIHRQWWYPYDNKRLKVAQCAIDLLHGSSWTKKLKALCYMPFHIFRR